MSALPTAPRGCRATRPRARSYAEHRRRVPYLGYLVSTRQSLVVTRTMLQAQLAHVDGALRVCTKYFAMARVRHFLERRVESSTQFVKGFRAIELLDDKAAFLESHLAAAHEDMAADPLWSSATHAELEESRTLMEKRFLCSIYRYVFFPHETAWMNDRLFHAHIEQHLRHITCDHAALQIPAGCRGEMPWPAAQQALLRLNAYKSPTDKLACIVDCCTTLMNLLQLGGQSAGADDFLPLLIFVIIKANPPNLLATVQYINFFGSSAVQSGEGGYWFRSFEAAVTQIQSMDDIPPEEGRV